MQVRADFDDFTISLLANLSRVIMEKMNEPIQGMKFFNSRKIQTPFVQDTGVTGLSLVNIRYEGEESELDYRHQKDSTRYDVEDYSKCLEITKEMIKDQKYLDMQRDSRELARVHRATKEVNLASVFNNGFDTDYTGADGYPLFSLTHKQYPSGSWANRPTAGTDFSVTALQTALNDIKGYTDDRGILIGAVGGRVVYPRQLHWLVKEIIGSPDRPDTTDRSINQLHREGLTSEEWLYLTDGNAWFVLPSKNEDHEIWFIDREGFDTEADKDIRKKSIIIVSGERYDFGWSDPKNIWGSPGST